MADDGAPQDVEPRSPTLADLRDLCRVLNERGAKYVVIGGFAIRAAGYSRSTMDIDLIVATDPDNEQRVLTALATLPDHAARELEVGEIDRYTVVRVADEIIVDLMKSAGGIDYASAAGDQVIHVVDGVPIPFASPRLLWRMKVVTHREKDAAGQGSAPVTSSTRARSVHTTHIKKAGHPSTLLRAALPMCCPRRDGVLPPKFSAPLRLGVIRRDRRQARHRAEPERVRPCSCA